MDADMDKEELSQIDSIDISAFDSHRAHRSKTTRDLLSCRKNICYLESADAMVKT